MPIKFEALLQSMDQRAKDQDAASQQAAEDQERRIAQLKELWANLGLEEMIEDAALKLAPSGITPVTIQQKGWNARGTGLLAPGIWIDTLQPKPIKVFRAVLFQYKNTEGLDRNTASLAALKFPKDQTFITIGHYPVAKEGWHAWDDRLGIKRLPPQKRRGEQQIVLPSGVEPFDPANGEHYKDLLDKSLVAIGERYYIPKDPRSR